MDTTCNINEAPGRTDDTNKLIKSSNKIVKSAGNNLVDNVKLIVL